MYKPSASVFVRLVSLCPLLLVFAGSGKADDAKAKEADKQVGDCVQSENSRWELRFKVATGSEYLEQLKAMGAELVIPIPDSKNYVLIADLSKPNDRKIVSEDDVKKRQAGKVKFSDSQKDAVRAVARSLEIIDVTSFKSFCAYFPKDLEEKLSRKELDYQNRRVDEIERTVFRVDVKNGKYEIYIEQQTIKR